MPLRTKQPRHVSRPVTGSIRHSQPWPTMRPGSSGLIAPPRAPYAVAPKNSRTNFPVLASHALTRLGEASASVTQSVPAVSTAIPAMKRHAVLLPGADQAASAGAADGAEQLAASVENLDLVLRIADADIDLPRLVDGDARRVAQVLDDARMSGHWLRRGPATVVPLETT